MQVDRSNDRQLQVQTEVLESARSEVRLPAHRETETKTDDAKLPSIAAACTLVHEILDQMAFKDAPPTNDASSNVNPALLYSTRSNLTDGSVEVFVQGAPEAVTQLEAWLQQGPPAARVDGVAEQAVDPTSAPALDPAAGFRVLR